MSSTIHPAMTTAGIVCPHCFKPMTFYTLLAPDAVPGRSPMRSYSGWCARMSCGHGVIAEQFLEAGVWKFHRFRIFCVDRSDCDGTFLQSDWILINPIPENTCQHPLVVTGPGGEYAHPIEVTTDSLMQTLLKILGQAREVVEALVPVLRIRQQPLAKPTPHEDNC